MYDGFSFITMTWLEAMGFCGKGESGPFVEGGAAHRPRRRAPAQHARRPALGRPAPRLRVPARGVRPALGRSGGAPGARRSRGRRRRGRWRPARRRAPAHPPPLAAGTSLRSVHAPGRSPVLRRCSASSSWSRSACASRTCSARRRTTSSSTTRRTTSCRPGRSSTATATSTRSSSFPAHPHRSTPAADHPPLTVFAIVPAMKVGDVLGLDAEDTQLADALRDRARRARRGRC